MNNQIKNLMKSLDISKEEALQVMQDDKAIDKGQDLFPLDDKQKQASKQMRQAGYTVYNFQRKSTPKLDNRKMQLISNLQNYLLNTERADKVEVINPQREITFYIDDTKYKIILSAPRK